MTSETRHTPGQVEPDESAQAVRRTPALIPRTPRTIFRALLGVLIFFCGILFGFWLIIRFRRET